MVQAQALMILDKKHKQKVDANCDLVANAVQVGQASR